jgi:hypothetical protein
MISEPINTPFSEMAGDAATDGMTRLKGSPSMRRFELHRDRDISGVSGLGRVAEGVQWTDGTCAVRWGANPYPSTVAWECIEHVEAVHGHNGATRIVWLD